MLVQTLAIVGVGLIGGSVGMAARARRVARHVVGTGRNPDALARARYLGCIDESADDFAVAAARADLMVFCTPVDRIAEQVLTAAPACRPGTLLTDAGSTKAAIVRAVDGRLPSGVAFVGSHPLAGSEKRGPEHARADLLDGRVVVVTPTEHSDRAAVERACEFWQALGARVRRTTPEDHDRDLAMTSHLPHLTASALAGVLPEELFPLTATGFRDTTRVAAGDPELWTAVFRHNRAAVLEAVAKLESRLDEFRAALSDDDAARLEQLLRTGKRVRDALGS
jgi:prephenate dehydrogenase